MFTASSTLAPRTKSLTAYAHHIAPRRRRSDFVLGILVSAALHGAVFYGDVLLPKRVAPPPVAEEEPAVIAIVMPPLPEDPPEEVAEIVEASGPPSFAPPSLADVPSIGPLTAFTQPLQPPPPPGFEANKGLSNIPLVRGTGRALGKDMKDLFDVASLDQIPSPRATVQPSYPFEQKRMGVSGTVIVEFIVDTRGDVVAAEVISSTDRGFEAPTLTAVRKWRFSPGRKNGRVVNTRVRQLVTFSLTDAE
jgi:periplasmic protein TonB